MKLYFKEGDFIKDIFFCKYYSSIEDFYKNKIDLEELLLKELNCENDWKKISKDYIITEEIANEFENKIDWDLYIRSNFLNCRILKQHKDRIDWPYISTQYLITDDILEEFKDELNSILGKGDIFGK